MKEVAWLKTGPGPSDFRHYRGERSITIDGDVDKETTSPLEVTRAVFNHFNLDKDWPGMRFVLGGEVMETEESMASLFRTLIIAIFGIYFLLVILFNSLTQPFLVMAAIPFGITGVIFAFAFHGEPFGFMAMMGIIGLSGVVVNDSLVMVSHINHLREDSDEPLREVLIAGASDRLRAIVLTTVTTLGGIFPMAYGLGGKVGYTEPMVFAMGWALAFATILTLIVLPCALLILDDIRRAGLWAWRKTPLGRT